MSTIKQIVFLLDSDIEITAIKSDDGYVLHFLDENPEDPDRDYENVVSIPLDLALDLVYAIESAKNGLRLKSEPKSAHLKISASFSRKEIETHLSVERTGFTIFVSTFYIDCREISNPTRYDLKTIRLHIDSVDELIRTVLRIIDLIEEETP